MALTKDVISSEIHERLGLPANGSSDLLEALLETIKVALEENRVVKIKGFGRWQTLAKPSRPGRNPHTGEKIEIVARSIVTFDPADKLRNKINAEVPDVD